ncbi:MAG: bifunctional UDP-N-acetylglucosamine diphosphorylase/glucosamine-1-phosphate N-acetyltransferase GlmU [Burkholderiaceae bacterium]|nr:bifunctional UDP-N-acetylglucosamine diphosphorylase/glucosamine-1-phosphate N-acetyltransferase GlmU [Burkholderiaceae bacterium]MEB2350705.1 bifunctional UDP-N-acetylglucosamine diphosphorylase/glucosamine-1-phosphate N-acetyltransferase GlmU [Burkholderiaceae bacterium]
MNVVILAAGMGKRMRSDLPKVLHPLAGQPLLAHVVDCARSLGAARIVVVYGHGGDLVPRAIDGTDLRWALQAPQLGTGHAVMQALAHLDAAGPTLVLYGDVPLIRRETLGRLIAAAGSDRLGLLTVELDDPSGYGRVVREGGRIVRIVEHKDADPATRAIREVNTGILVAPTAALARWLGALSNDNAQKEYYLTDVVAAAVHDGVEVASARPVDVVETLGVNSKAQLAALERAFQSRLAQRLMDEGVQLADPARLDVRGELTCGRDVSIDVNCIFEGKVDIGDGASIGAHCVVRDTRIGAGAQILPFTLIENASIGARARIGPFARLRPGTELGEETHVGNFVEMKNTRMAAKSKANHLSYLGDTVVGERVNIGAGTITCNYDGASKYQTVIEDDAFIGSDTQLVAPVRVGRGATLGAGTTLTRDAPEDKLTLSRTPQTTVESWQRPAGKAGSKPAGKP